MIKLVKHDSRGCIESVVFINPEFADKYPDYIQVDQSCSVLTHYIQNGVAVEKPEQISPSHEWDWPTFSWVLNLSTAKAQAKDRITTARNRAVASGFTAFGKVFDSDSTAVQRISVGVQAANAVGESFTVEWTCADNSTITLDYAMMQALPAFMADVANTLHVKARTLKDQIDLATTLEEVQTITW